MMVRLPAIPARYGLAMLLVATLAKGLAWSIVVPPFHAHDEMQHFLYAQGVERFQTVRVELGRGIPEEVRILDDLAQLDATLYHPKTLDLSDRAAIAGRIARLNDPAVKKTYVPHKYRGKADVDYFASYHPPLYYLVAGAIQAPLEQESILVRLLATRWLSVLLAMVTVFLAYQAGRELWPDRPGWALLLATTVSFQPMMTFTGAVAGNQSLEIALFSACLLISLRAIKGGLSKRGGAALGALLGLGLLTKISFMAALPLLGLLFVRDAVRALRGWGLGNHSESCFQAWNVLRILWPWFLVLLLPPLICGWWYRDALFSGGETLVRSYGEIRGGRGLEVALDTLKRQVASLALYTKMYWGSGWDDVPIPHPVLRILILITAIGQWETGWWLVRRIADRVHNAPRADLFALLFLGCATLAIALFYSYLDFRLARDLGGVFIVQGRYFLPAIIGQMAWMALGLARPVPSRWRQWWSWLIGAGMVALNLYSLFGALVPRYYGAGSLLQQLERAAILQPVEPIALLALCVAYVALSLAVIAALGLDLASIRGEARRASATPEVAVATLDRA